MTKEEIIQKLQVFTTPAFSFDEDKHEYTLNGQKLKSVTGWYPKAFVKPFDSAKFSEKKAIQYGVANTDILNGWNVLATDAADLGHDVHKFIELYLSKQNPELPSDEVQRNRVIAWLDFYDKKLSKMELVAQELRVWSKTYGLAGTIDALFWYKDQLVVGDWKTNKAMKTDEDKHWANLLFPFENEKENTLNKYSLQVSTYRAILKDHGIPCDKAFICWIGPNAEVKMYGAKDYLPKIENYLMSFPVK